MQKKNFFFVLVFYFFFLLQILKCLTWDLISMLFTCNKKGLPE